jgi:hypothetical protein
VPIASRPSRGLAYSGTPLAAPSAARVKLPVRPLAPLVLFVAAAFDPLLLTLGAE